MKYYSFTPKIVWIILAAGALTFAGFLVALMINEGAADKTVIETYAGTKSVCAGTRYDYGVKHTVCTGYKSVPATCMKTEVVGPIFKAFVRTECK